MLLRLGQQTLGSAGNARVRVDGHFQGTGHVALISIDLKMLESRRHEFVERVFWCYVDDPTREHFAGRCFEL